MMQSFPKNGVLFRAMLEPVSAKFGVHLGQVQCNYHLSNIISIVFQFAVLSECTVFMVMWNLSPVHIEGHSL